MPNADAARRFSRWRELAPEEMDFQKRRWLVQNCAQEDCFVSLLGEVTPLDGDSLPKWAVLLGALSETVESGVSSADLNALPGRCRIPFSDLLLPMVHLAQQQLVAPASDLIKPGAWRGLTDLLLSQLSAICALALQSDFLAFRAVSRSGMANMFGLPFKAVRSSGSGGGGHYANFIREQGDDGLSSFFCNYPVAGRLCAQSVENWQRFVGDFITRLVRDEEEIARFWPKHDRQIELLRIQASGGDPHHGGQGPLILHFAGDRRLVYKPRSVEVEESFSDLLLWMNKNGGHLLQTSLRVLSRKGYGWVEFASHRECRSRSEVERFYSRAGSLLAIVHALRGVDLHRENLVAAGAFPIIVDLEGLCHPPVPKRSSPDVPRGDSVFIDETVLRTGLLPVFQMDPCEGRYIDVSGLGSPTRLRSIIPGLRWKAVNTDNMMVVPEKRVGVSKAHRPCLAGKPVDPHKFADHVVAGFRRSCALLRRFEKEPSFVELKQQVLAAPTRLIKRSTLVYRTILQSLQNPGLLRSGVDRSIEILRLPQPDGTAEQGQYESEIEALENLDIPYFVKDSQSKQNATTAHVLSTQESAAQVTIIRTALKRRMLSRNGLATPQAASKRPN